VKPVVIKLIDETVITVHYVMSLNIKLGQGNSVGIIRKLRDKLHVYIVSHCVCMIIFLLALNLK